MGTGTRVLAGVGAIGVLVTLGGCVLGRRTLTLPELPQAVVAAPKGVVYIGAISDDRHFENHPDDPSTPSIDGDVATLTPELKDRMVGRQRNA